jgi:hypothetical protein
MAMVIGFCTYADISTIEHSLHELYEQVKLNAQLVPDRMITIEQPSELLELICRALDSDQESMTMDASREMLTDCMHKLRNGCVELPLNSLMKIMPALIRYACPETESLSKAVRPDTNENSTISGCSAPCDNSAILRLLNQIRIELAECCDDIERSFQETWTILASLTFEVVATVTVDLSGIFTALDVCCREINQDFNNVFTALEDIRSTLTECCAAIDRDFNATWTILVSGFGDTFTLLTDIRGTLTECCAEIDRDFNATWTILGNGFGGTFTILNDIRSTLTECCAEIQHDFDGVFTVLENLSCGQIQQITAPTTITSPGVYCVANQINGSIAILSSNVVLDLNQQIITGDGITLISVIGPVQNIEIKNGTLLNGNSSTGISLIGSIDRINNVNISDIQIINDAIGSALAIQMNGASNVRVVDVFISGGRNITEVVSVTGLTQRDNVEFVNMQIANVTLTSATARVIAITGATIRMIDCVISDNGSLLGSPLNLTGVLLQSSRNIAISNLKIANNFSTQNFIGIETSLSSDIIIENSQIVTNIGADSSIGINAANVDRIIIQDNLVERNFGSTPATGVGVGIRFDTTSESLIKNNSIRVNQGAAPSSGILFLAANSNNTIIENEVFGHTTNFNLPAPLPPIIEYDISANTVTPVPATVTSYHNLSTVL